MDVTFVELDDSLEGLTLLKRYYQTLHISEFPDPDERESYDNLVKYLQNKNLDWYGKNNYHIVLMMDGDTVAGGTIFDYYYDANGGFGEFITIKREYRNKGLFKKLFYKRTEILNEDARKNGFEGIDWLVVEMNKPDQTEIDSFNPQDRLKIWDTIGFKILDFNYIQPALEEGKKPVTNLYLLTRIYNHKWSNDFVSSGKVIKLLYAYVRYAFDIENPEKNQIFKQMKQELEQKEKVSLLSMT